MSILENKIWLIVCDMRKALLLQNAGDAVYPKLELRAEFGHSDRPTHELGSDHPGRVFASQGRRSSLEPSDMQSHEEDSFLRTVASELQRRVAAGEIRRLVVTASPHALGKLRSHLSPQTSAVIKAEFHKDLVREPLYEIEKHFEHV